MTALLTEAIRALSEDPDRDANADEVRRVADILIKSGDEETLDVLDEATWLDDSYKALAEFATEAGASPFVALDLVTAYGMRRAGEPAVLRR